MLENMIYPAIGFVVTLLGLEVAWRLTACRIPDKTIKPCLYKKAILTPLGG